MNTSHVARSMRWALWLPAIVSAMGCACPLDEAACRRTGCPAPGAEPNEPAPAPAASKEVPPHFPVIEVCNPNPEPVPPGAGESLGVASYPPETCMRDATMFKWQVPTLRPPKYRLGYALSSSEASASREGHRGYASDRGATWLSDNRWAWVPPPGCDDPWRCLYATLVARDRPLLQPLAAKLRQRADQSHLTTTQAAELVLRFVQSLRYEAYTDASEPFGIRPPALVAMQRGGDCDSKALLGLVLLREVGIDAVLISSVSHQHAMLGIAVPSPGKSFAFRGRKYAYAECASATAPLGFITPTFLQPNDWKVVEFALPQ